MLRAKSHRHIDPERRAMERQCSHSMQLARYKQSHRAAGVAGSQHVSRKRCLQVARRDVLRHVHIRMHAAQICCRAQPKTQSSGDNDPVEDMEDVRAFFPTSRNVSVAPLPASSEGVREGDQSIAWTP